MSGTVYVILNCNAEGENLVGVYDDKAKADAACEKVNAATRRENLSSWERCHVAEVPRNTVLSYWATRLTRAEESKP